MRRRYLLLAAASPLCLAGPALAETTLNVVMQAPLRTLDPILSTAQIVRTHGFMVFDTLLGMDGLHPNDAGYKVMADAFFAAIKARFEE